MKRTHSAAFAYSPSRILKKTLPIGYISDCILASEESPRYSPSSPRYVASTPVYTVAETLSTAQLDSAHDDSNDDFASVLRAYVVSRVDFDCENLDADEYEW